VCAHMWRGHRTFADSRGSFGGCYGVLVSRKSLIRCSQAPMCMSVRVQNGHKTLLRFTIPDIAPRGLAEGCATLSLWLLFLVCFLPVLLVACFARCLSCLLAVLLLSQTCQSSVAGLSMVVNENSLYMFVIFVRY
jgi:hypothetical protein